MLQRALGRPYSILNDPMLTDLALVYWEEHYRGAVIAEEDWNLQGEFDFPPARDLLRRLIRVIDWGAIYED
jgi:hypothetical protein